MNSYILYSYVFKCRKLEPENILSLTFFFSTYFFLVYWQNYFIQYVGDHYTLGQCLKI